MDRYKMCIRDRGYTVTINKKTYTIVKKGDVTGDANINSGDLLKLQKHLLKDANISGTPYGLSLIHI